MSLAVKKKKRIRRAPAWMRPVSAVLAVLATVVLMRSFVLDIRPVRGGSMEPALCEGEWVLIFKPVFSMRTPQHGELWVFTPDAAQDDWIKRVVGLPEERLYAQEGQLYRDGVPVDEPYLAEGTPDFPAIQSWAGEYLMLGDHRAGSSDSREQVIGAIPRDHLIGRAALVVWPPYAWRFL